MTVTRPDRSDRAGWLLIADTEVQVLGLAEDRCAIERHRDPENPSLVRIRTLHEDFSELDRQLAVRGLAGDDRDAAAVAVAQLARALGGVRVYRVFATGVLSTDALQAALAIGEHRHVAEVTAAREASINEGSAHPSAIVALARELGLGPEPAGSAGQWSARCPGTNHTIMVSPRSEQFGCGYCRVKVDPSSFEPSSLGGPARVREVPPGRPAGVRVPQAVVQEPRCHPFNSAGSDPRRASRRTSPKLGLARTFSSMTPSG